MGRNARIRKGLTGHVCRMQQAPLTAYVNPADASRSAGPRRGVGLLLTPCWEPEPGPAPRRAQLLAVAMQQADLDVRVVAWQPNRPFGRVWKGYRHPLRVERKRDWTVIRVRPILAPRHRFLLRGIAEAASSAALAAVGVSAGQRCRLVVATTPSMFVGIGAAVVAKILRVPFWLDVRDLIWEYAAGLGAANRARRLRRMVLWAARRAAAVTTTTTAQAAYFAEHGVHGSRVHAVRNPVDPSWVQSTERLAEDYPATTSRDGAPLHVLYAGLIGLPQGLDTVLHAAKLLETENVKFLLAGDGPDAPRLRSLAQELRLSNVEFLGHLDRAELLKVYAQADVCYAQLRDGAGFATAYPTKLLEYMSAGRPIIFGGRGEAAEEIVSVGCGMTVKPDVPTELVTALRLLQANRGLRVEMGRKGRQHVIHSRSTVATQTQFGRLVRCLALGGHSAI